MTNGDLFPVSAATAPGAVTRLGWEVVDSIIAMPMLRSDPMWQHPLLQGRGDDRLRADMMDLAGRMPAMLELLDALPQLLMHGDACPQNLLVPADDPTSLVAVDWSMAGLAAVGYDLGQLLIGHAHSGQLEIERLPDVQDRVLHSYRAGLADEGWHVDEDVVRMGFDAALVLRSAFLSLPLQQLSGASGDASDEFVRNRVRLTRWLVDLGLSLPLVRP